MLMLNGLKKPYCEFIGAWSV